MKPKKTRQTATILLVLGVCALILGISLIGLVLGDVKPLTLFSSQNSVYSVDFTPTSALVAINQSQLFSTTLKFDASTHVIAYLWTVDGNTIPVTGSSCFLFFATPGSHQIICIVTVDGTTPIYCYGTLTVTGGSTYIAPTATPNQILNLVPTDPLLKDLMVVVGAAFTAFGSMAILISRRV